MENTAKIESVELNAGGRWLTIQIRNAGVSSSCFFYANQGRTTGEVEIRNMTKESIRELRDHLIEICRVWPIRSGEDEDFLTED